MFGTPPNSLFGAAATVMIVGTLNAPAGTVTLTPVGEVNVVSSSTGATKPLPSAVTNGVSGMTAMVAWLTAS